MLSCNETTGKYYWNAKEITEQKYQEIREIIRNKPQAPEGQDYRLTDDLKWELYDLPPALPEEDPDQAEYDALVVSYKEGVNNS